MIVSDGSNAPRCCADCAPPETADKAKYHGCGTPMYNALSRPDDVPYISG